MSMLGEERIDCLYQLVVCCKSRKMSGDALEEDLRLLKEVRAQLKSSLAKEEMDTCIQRVYYSVNYHE